MGEVIKDFLDDSTVLLLLFFFILLIFLSLEILDCPWNPIKDFIKNHNIWKNRYLSEPIYGYSSHNASIKIKTTTEFLCTSPSTWKLSFSESTGANQSPINIDTRNCLVKNPSTTLKTENWDTVAMDMSLQNNGHTVILMGEWSYDCYPTITGGPLGDAIYKFSCASFRWGPNDDEGSEHTIDNNRFCLEIQISNTRVTTNKDNGCFKDNNIAIITILYNVTNGDNPYLDYIVNNLNKIKYPSQPLWIQPFPLKWLKKTFSSCYYAYSGSLTHPPCSECVTWIVFPQTVSISTKQVEQFRTLYSRNGEPILTNTRPVQLLNCRNVFYYD